MKFSARYGWFAAVFAVGGVLALAACGGSSSSSDQVASLPSDWVDPAANTGGSSTSPSTSPQQAFLDFAKCMRANGVDVPDPTFDSNGRPQFQQGQGGQFDRNDPQFQAARQKCAPILQKAFQQRITPQMRQAFQTAALKYAQCMRANGVNIPDPDFSNGPGGGGGFFGNLNRNDPKFQAANDKCRSAFSGLRGPFGGGSRGSSQ